MVGVVEDADSKIKIIEREKKTDSKGGSRQKKENGNVTKEEKKKQIMI